jgi:hypothetical protein
LLQQTFPILHEGKAIGPLTDVQEILEFSDKHGSLLTARHKKAVEG